MMLFVLLCPVRSPCLGRGRGFDFSHPASSRVREATCYGEGSHTGARSKQSKVCEKNPKCWWCFERWDFDSGISDTENYLLLRNHLGLFELGYLNFPMVCLEPISHFLVLGLTTWAAPKTRWYWSFYKLVRKGILQSIIGIADISTNQKRTSWQPDLWLLWRLMNFNEWPCKKWLGNT